jgi:hypothetical protein
MVMKLSELHRLVNVYHNEERMVREDPEVVIQIKLPYSTVGAQPTVPVKFISMGFDWDAGKFMITPEENLTPADRDFAEKMRKMQEDLGWAKYENRSLKAEIKQLRKQLGEQNDRSDSQSV